MLKSPSAIKRPTFGSIYYHRFVRYVKIGAFLHVMALVGCFLFVVNLHYTMYYFEDQQFVYGTLTGILTACFFTVPFFAQLDALGRYQNYKQIKDALFIRGYDKRLIKPFMYSKCQRDAVLVAAEDLNCHKEVFDFYYKQGYRYYHILPDAFVKNPLVLFQGMFWNKILFTDRYQLKYFYW
jgi:hypothetical protein